MSDPARLIRDRQGYQDFALDVSGGNETEGNAAILGTTSTLSSYPTSASAFYYMTNTEINGYEQEGSSATYVQVTGANFYAFNAGTQIPPNGTTIVCHEVGGKWTFRYDG